MKMYKLHKQGFKYYIVPSRWTGGRLPYPDNFLSAFTKKKAQIILEAMEGAYEDGYLDRVFEVM